MTTTIQRPTQTIPTTSFDRLRLTINQTTRQVMASCDRCETAVRRAVQQAR